MFVFYKRIFPLIILGFLTIKCTKVIQQSIYYKDDRNTVYSLCTQPPIQWVPGLSRG